MDKANLAEAVNGHIDNKVITPKVLRQWGDKVGAVSVVGKASKNLYDKNNVYIEGASNQNAGNNILVLPNTTYTFSIGKYTYGEVKEFDNSGVQINDIGGSESSKIITFTTSSNAKYITTLFFTGTYNNVSLNEIDFTQIQLELGSTATEYEEYFEPTISIKDSNGDYHEVPYVAGKASKNLFNAYKYGENNTHTGNVSKYSIINPNEIEISYINGWSRLVLTVTGLEPSTVYTISAYLDKSNFNTSVASGFYDGSEYKDSGFTKGSGNVYLTFTSSSTGTFDMWFYGNWSGTNYSGSIVYENIQIEKGSVPTLYERHFEPTISIKDSNGDYHEVPYVAGKASKNLFDKATMVEFPNGYRLYTNGTFNNNSSFYGLKIPVQPNTTYTSSSNLTDTNLWSDLCFFDKSMNFISGVEGRANKTFTTPANCYFVTYAIYNQYQWFQLEKGSTVTEYEKYFEPSISIRDNNGIFQDVKLNVDNFPQHIGNSYSESSPFTYALDGYINLIFTYQSSHGSCGGVYVAFRGKITGDRLVTIVASQHVKSISFSDGVLTVTPDSWGVEVVTMKIR